MIKKTIEVDLVKIPERDTDGFLPIEFCDTHGINRRHNRIGPEGQRLGSATHLVYWEGDWIGLHWEDDDNEVES